MGAYWHRNGTDHDVPAFGAYITPEMMHRARSNRSSVIGSIVRIDASSMQSRQRED